MAITTYGVAGSMDVPAWQQMMDAIAGPRVISGLAVSVATGTRLVNVTAGVAYRAGALATMDAPTTATFTANTSGSTRTDHVALRIDGAGTQAGATTVVVFTGTSVPTSVPGGVVYVPLADVRIANGAGQLVSTDITEARPGNFSTHVTATTNSSGLATITHNLGVVPAWVEATVLNSNWLATPLYTSRTTATFQVAVRALNTGALVTSTSAEFLWKAEA